ncbi:MAG TPA: GIY-YIG nuclease family protein [Vitreimonas sp.]|uniref:GIY-YIG nuclease family protein n=1 Tax=Vitreimonas sp. TaxID=3069702 RepID=UPI002D71243B|nr:GIY-YIG nuclease family protein [Vitreimonas sp.]HYD89342.1 GIY-YIG nuclease family protein [Vitreimonas sp.]
MFFFGAHSWRGESGRRYRFKCVLTKGGLPPGGQGGIYIFVRRRWAFFLEVLYVGKAHDLRSRLLGHEKWGRAYWYYGATERYVLGPIRDEADRRRIETDLIHSLKPRMNDVEIPQAKAAASKRKAAASHAFDMSALLGRRTQRAA